MSKDKSQIALRNGCEDHVAPNYMIGLTAFKYCEIDMIFIFQICNDFFYDQIISNSFCL